MNPMQQMQPQQPDLSGLIAILQSLPPEMLMGLFAQVMGGMGQTQQPSMAEIGGGLQQLLSGEMGRAGQAAHRFPGERVDTDVQVFEEASEVSPLAGLLGPQGGMSDFERTRRAQRGIV